MHLQYFDSHEFGEQSGLISDRLKILLDLWRHRLGCPVTISPVDGALVRQMGSESQSAHNVDYWGECLAADVFAADVWTQREAKRAIELATGCGFTGIGIYADTHNIDGIKQPMFHLDVRPTHNMGDPATWGRVDGKYVAISQAIDNLPGGR